MEASALTAPGLPALHLELSAGLGAAREARAAVSDIAAALPALDRLILLVLVSEVTDLAVTGDWQTFDLHIWRTESGFLVEFGHHGPGSPNLEIDASAAVLLDRLATDWYSSDGLIGFELEVTVPFSGDESDEELLTLAAAGDSGGHEALVERYEGFARVLSHRYAKSGIDREDLEQAALFGLFKAIERYDPDRGVKFTTFASRTIDGELKRHLRDTGWSVRVPRSLQELGLEAVRVHDALSQELGREPTLEEISDSVDADDSDISQALLARRSFSAASLDASIGDERSSLVDAIPVHDERLRRAPDWADLSSVIDDLPERQRRILYLRFFEDLSQARIAEIVGISQMHVSRLLSRSFDRIRTLIEGRPTD